MVVRWVVVGFWGGAGMGWAVVRVLGVGWQGVGLSARGRGGSDFLGSTVGEMGFRMAARMEGVCVYVP